MATTTTPPPAPLPLNIFVLSSASEESMEQVVQGTASWLDEFSENNSSPSLMEIAHSSAVNFDPRHPHRLAVLGSSVAEITSKLRNGKYSKGFLAPGSSPPKLCFLHPGLGSNYPNMGFELFNTFPKYRAFLDEWHSPRGKQFLKSTEIETPDLFNDMMATASALGTLFNSWGIHPDFSLGHSVGEYPAALSAGIYGMNQLKKFIDGLRSYDRAFPPAKVVIILADEATFSPIMNQVDLGSDGWLEVAVRNTETQFVIGGGENQVMEFAKLCMKNDIPAFMLPLHHAFHTTPYRKVEKKIQQLGETLAMSKPTATFISAMTGNILETMPSDYWAEHLWKQVNFVAASRTALECGARVFLELGGKPILGSLLVENSKGLEVERLKVLYSLKQGKSELETMFTSLAELFTMGYNVNWQGFYKDFQITTKINLPDFNAITSSHTNGFSSNPPQLEILEDDEYDHVSFWTAMDSTTSIIEKRDIIQRLLITILKSVMDVEPTKLESNTDLRDLGIDSVQIIWVKVALDKVLGSRASVGITMLISSFTMNQLTQNLFSLIYPTQCPIKKQVERIEQQVC